MRYTVRTRALSAIVAAGIAGAACSGDPQGPTPVPDGNIVDIVAVTHGAEFLAVGADMATAGDSYVPGHDRVVVGRSADGASWEWYTVGAAGALLAVSYGEGVYVAGGVRISAGGAGSAIMFSSTDGIEWQEVGVPGATAYTSIAYGNGMFLATGVVGGIGTVVSRSTNGVDWEGAAETALLDTSINFAAGRFHLTGNAGVVFSTANGQQWQTRSTSEVNRVGRAAEIAGDMVASASFTSPGAVDYFTISGGGEGALSVTASEHDGLIARLVEGNGVVVGVGSGVMLRSTDLTDWDTTLTVNEPFELQDVTFANGLFVAAGRANLRTSTDGTSWTAIPIPDAVAERP